MPSTDTTVKADEDDITIVESSLEDSAILVDDIHYSDYNNHHQDHNEFVISAFPLPYHHQDIIDDEFTYEELLLEEYLVYERIIKHLAMEYDLSVEEVSGELFPKLLQQFGYIGDNDLADAFWMSVVSNEGIARATIDYLLTDGGETYQQQFQEDGQFLGYGVPEMIFHLGLVVSIVLGWHVCRQWWKKGKLGICGLSSVLQRWRQAVVIEELLAAEDGDQNAKVATAAFNGGNRIKTKKKGRTSKKQPSSRLSYAKKNKSLIVPTNKESALARPTSTIDQLGEYSPHSPSSQQPKLTIPWNSLQQQYKKNRDEQDNRESQELEKQQCSGILHGKEVNDFQMARRQANEDSEHKKCGSSGSNETKDDFVNSNHQGQETTNAKEICNNSGENLLSCHCDKCEKEREIFQLIIEKSLGDGGGGGCTFSVFSGGQTIQIVVNGNGGEDDNNISSASNAEGETFDQDDARWEVPTSSSSESKHEAFDYSDETFGVDVHDCLLVD